jgi:methanogenic corrinoid protein MtbC1/DNA-binding XRE family transcriptional regulator
MSRRNNDDFVLLKRFKGRLLNHLTSVDRTGSVSVIEEALRYNCTPAAIYNSVITPAMVDLGELWHGGRITIAHEHHASQIVDSLINMVAQKSQRLLINGLRALVTSPSGENHWIGAKIFANLLFLEGWDVEYIGVDTPAEDLAIYLTEVEIDVVAFSVVLPGNIMSVEDAVSTIESLDNPPFVILGGPAFKGFSGEIGKAAIVDNSATGLTVLQDAMGIGAGKLSLQDTLLGVGGKVLEIRRAKGMNQGELAVLAGVDRAYISLVENGKQNLTMAALFKLAEALGTSVNTLLAFPTN